MVPLQAALEQQQYNRRRGMRGRRGLDVAVARRRQEKAAEKALRAAERKARDVTREQKQRRLELAVEEKRMERRAQRRAAKAAKAEREREIQALESIVLDALKSEKEAAEAALQVRRRRQPDPLASLYFQTLPPRRALRRGSGEVSPRN